MVIIKQKVEPLSKPGEAGKERLSVKSKVKRNPLALRAEVFLCLKKR
jgi:hypothetical protein